MKERPPIERERQPSFAVRRVFACVLLVSLGLLPVRAVETVDNTELRLGFTSSVFVGVNENDARAAMKIWTQAILKEHGILIPSDPRVLTGTEAIASAVQNKKIDAITMTAEEYWTLGREWMATNVILGVSDGVATENYLLLVHRDSGIARINDLRGHSIVFFQNPRASLAPLWFENLLLKAGLGQTAQFCSRTIQGVKLSQTVLPVFFRQFDACVVTRRGFQVMSELNPQVGQQLKILASSPSMVPVAFLFRADYSDPAKDRIIKEIQGVHSTIAGQQVLTLFQCESLKVLSVAALDSSLELLATHARLMEALNKPGSAGTEKSLTLGKTDK